MDRKQRGVKAGYRLIAISVSSAVFMQFLDSGAIGTAIPAIARALHLPPVDLNIAVISSQLATAAFIPVGTFIAERLGGRNAFVLALLTYLAGSLLCSQAPSLTFLAAARALQGIGGAVLIPVSRLLVVRSADKSELLSAMNWLLIPGIVGPLMGPAVGGFIVMHFSWRWVFLINLPVGLLSMAMVMTFVPNSRDEVQAEPDFIGMVLAGPALFALVFGLERLSHAGDGPFAAALLALGSMLVLLYLRHARRATAPVIDPTLLSVPSFRHSLVAGSLMRMAAGGTGFLFPLWLQLAMGKSPQLAGSIIMMSALTGLATRVVSVPLYRVVHPHTAATWGAVLLAGSLLLFALLRPGMPLPLFYLVMGVQGLVVSVPMMVVSTAAYLEIPAERTAQAAAFYTMFQQLTLSIGVTAGVWAVGLTEWLASTNEHDALTYSGAFVTLAFLALSAVPSAARFEPDTIGVLSERRR